MELLVSFLQIQNESSVIFFLTTFMLMLFAGEPAVLAIALFAAVADTLSVTELMITAYITALSGELFWFFVGRSPSINSVAQKPYLRIFRANLDLSLKKIQLDHPLHLLISTRIFTGIAIPMIIHLSQNGLSLKKFILYSLVVNAIWTPITVGVGYAAGKGYETALNIFEGVRSASMTLLVLLIGMYIGYRSLLRKIR